MLQFKYNSFWDGYRLDCYAIEEVLEPFFINPVICPYYLEKDTLDRIIPRLNDQRGWTREEIAQWLQEQGL